MKWTIFIDCALVLFITSEYVVIALILDLYFEAHI